MDIVFPLFREYSRIMETNKFDELIAFRARAADRAEVREIAVRWQLDESEIARRALREGLRVLREYKIPGTREVRGD
jgi:hypothetical protein